MTFVSVALLAAAGASTGAPQGQWVWSAADRAIFDGARTRWPNLIAGPWVSTLSFHLTAGAPGAPEITQQLGVAPQSLANRSALALVVRFDDSFHGAWDRLTLDQIADRLRARLAALFAAVRRSGASIAEVQLDYDCPTRRLEAWATVLRVLTSGSGELEGVPLWITSLPAHVRTPNYGRWLRGAVRGHILQLFDTGVSPSEAVAVDLGAQLERQGIPYRIGLGAFERVGAHGQTNHRGWFSLLPILARGNRYEGAWIFPAGRPWSEAWEGEGRTP